MNKLFLPFRRFCDALPTKLITTALISTAAFLPACSTVSTVTGPVDAGRGEVTGQFYYLPKARIRIQGGKAKDNDKEWVIAFTPILVPDTKRYYLEPRTNVFYDDEFKLHANSKGLLETVNLTSDDKTATIIGDLAAIGADIMRFGAGAVEPPGIKTVPGKAPERRPFDYTFDPENEDEVKLITENMRQRGWTLTIDGGAVPMGVAGASYQRYEFPEKGTNGSRQEGPGIVFRPLRPLIVTITDQAHWENTKDFYGKRAAAAAVAEEKETLAAVASNTPATPEIVAKSTLQVPDRCSQLLFRVGRTPFVKRTDNLVFVDGILTKVEGSRPSPVVGFLQIPKNVLKAIVPLPLDLRNIQINNIEAQRKLETLQSSAE